MLNLPWTTRMGLMYENSPGPFLLTAATLNSTALPNKRKHHQRCLYSTAWDNTDTMIVAQ